MGDGGLERRRRRRVGHNRSSSFAAVRASCRPRWAPAVMMMVMRDVGRSPNDCTCAHTAPGAYPTETGLVIEKERKKTSSSSEWWWWWCGLHT